MLAGSHQMFDQFSITSSAMPIDDAAANVMSVIASFMPISFPRLTASTIDRQHHLATMQHVVRHFVFIYRPSGLMIDDKIFN